MKIDVTRKPDGAIVKIDPLEIKFLRPGLFECEIHFEDGSSILVSQTEKQITILVRNAFKAMRIHEES